MPETLLEPLREWQTFYLLIGGAAASLAGLMFVAISLGSGTITRKDADKGLRVFVNPTLLHFVYVLVVALVVVVPSATRMRLGIILAIGGVISAGWALATIPYLRQQHRAQAIDLQDWTWYLLTPIISYLLFAATGVGFLLGVGVAVDGLALGSILLLIAGIRNAWDFVMYLILRPDDTSGQ